VGRGGVKLHQVHLFLTVRSCTYFPSHAWHGHSALTLRASASLSPLVRRPPTTVWQSSTRQRELSSVSTTRSAPRHCTPLISLLPSCKGALREESAGQASEIAVENRTQLREVSNGGEIETARAAATGEGGGSSGRGGMEAGVAGEYVEARNEAKASSPRASRSNWTTSVHLTQGAVPCRSYSPALTLHHKVVDWHMLSRILLFGPRHRLRLA